MRPPAAGAARPSIWGDLRAGLRYVAAWPGLLAIIVMAMVLNFIINPAFSLMPILVTKHFGGRCAAAGLAGIGLGHRAWWSAAWC